MTDDQWSRFTLAMTAFTLATALWVIIPSHQIFTIVSLWYAIFSALLGVKRLIEKIAWEDAINSTPRGDWWLLGDPPVLLDKWTTIFFPATIVIWLWRGYARLANKAIDRQLYE